MSDKPVTKKINIFRSLNKRLVVLLLIMGALFFISQIYFTSKVGTKGAEVEQIRIEKNELRLQNEILLSKINEETSTKSLKNLAKNLNLVEKNVADINPAINNDKATAQVK